MVVVTIHDLPPDYQYLPLEETPPPDARVTAMRFGRWDDLEQIPPGVLRVAAKLCDDLAALRRRVPRPPDPNAGSWWPKAWQQIRAAHRACVRYRTVALRCAPQYQRTLNDDEEPQHVCATGDVCPRRARLDRWSLDPETYEMSKCRRVWDGRGSSLVYNRLFGPEYRCGEVDCVDNTGVQRNMSHCGYRTVREFERARVKAPVLKKYSYVPAADAAHV